MRQWQKTIQLFYAVEECSSDKKCSSTDHFCDFWKGEVGGCMECNFVENVEECDDNTNDLGNDKGITDCKQTCFSKFH